ncbi:hypothetical protein EVAR_92973_1 [Eumeta japonica]|uniref:Uncharacterized protein n=1 Tax=Eumeta variegata TaxID=151549 RepID=A0A4C1TBH2_EUMVA|nr:hypothetical protein EVAR_92973_1 [Eumeta japonica]
MITDAALLNEKHRPSRSYTMTLAEREQRTRLGSAPAQSLMCEIKMSLFAAGRGKLFSGRVSYLSEY